MQQKYYTTINGKPVQLQHVQYTSHIYHAHQVVHPSEAGKRVVEPGTGGKYFAIGQLINSTEKYEADRMIFRKANPSNHKCSSRCRGATGHDCECSCGGQFHGVDA